MTEIPLRNNNTLRTDIEHENSSRGVRGDEAENPVTPN